MLCIQDLRSVGPQHSEPLSATPQSVEVTALADSAVGFAQTSLPWLLRKSHYHWSAAQCQSVRKACQGTPIPERPRVSQCLCSDHLLLSVHWGNQSECLKKSLLKFPQCGGAQGYWGTDRCPSLHCAVSDSPHRIPELLTTESILGKELPNLELEHWRSSLCSAPHWPRALT